MTRSSDNTNYFKGYYNQSPGIADVGSYQVAGYPWITGSIIVDEEEHIITFPSVTKQISIQNKTLAGAGVDTDIRVHFATKVDSGVYGNHQYIKLAGVPTGGMMDAMGQMTLSVKCDTIYISAPGGTGNDATYELQALLTGISSANMFELTGSGISSR
jgi:hypothetical protein|tara:strand:+ start:538 stop:1011 length:474 start_codon:yes stop_codon:yes gene_type:complete